MAEYAVVDKTQLEADLTVVADAIRAKSGTEEKLEFPSGFKSVVDNIPTPKQEQEKTISITENGTTEVVPDEGKVLSKVSVNVEVESGGSGNFDEAWYEASKNWTWYMVNNTGIFRTWTGKTLPRLDFSNATSIRYLFVDNKNIERIDFYINSQKATNAYQSFMNCSSLKFLYGVDFRGMTGNNSIYETFKNCTSLETIQEPITFGNATGNISGTFVGCTQLKNVSFVENAIRFNLNFANSSFLSDESIQSIIDGLAPAETTQTLTLHADVKAKLTDEQIAQITSKNWTLA